MKEPTKSLLRSLPNFIGKDSSGLFFRNKEPIYYKHFSKLSKYYTLSRKKIQEDAAICLEKENLEKDLEKRFSILLSIQIILSDTNDLINNYIEKINNKEKPIPKIGFEGTIKIFKKVGNFYKNHMNTLFDIYIHEHDVFSILIAYMPDWKKSFLFSEEEISYHFQEIFNRIDHVKNKYKAGLSLAFSEKSMQKKTEIDESKKLLKRNSSTKIRPMLNDRIPSPNTTTNNNLSKLKNIIE